MQAQDSHAQFKADAVTLFAHAVQRRNVIVTGTEAGQSQNGAAVEAAASAQGFWSWVHGSGEWCAFDKSWATHVDHGWVGVIPAGYGHAARGICWVTLQPKDTATPRISVGSMHFLTSKSSEQEPNANSQLQAAALKFAQDKGKSGLVFLNADTNMSDQSRNVWGTSQIVTAWDELGKWPGTIETGARNTIDVISRYGSGTRFTAARRYTDADVPLYTDHQLIEATAALV